MNFKNLYRIICENDTQLTFDLGDDSMDSYESWTEFLDDNNYGISIENLRSLIKKFNTGFRFPNNQNKSILLLFDNENQYWLKSNDGEEYEVWATNEEDLNHEIWRLSESDMLDYLGIKEDDIYIDGWECTIKDLRENPGVVYHYTTEEGWDNIQKDGFINPMCKSRGLSNRNVGCAIFCSVNSEEYETGTYGNVCLALNLTDFMKSQNLSSLYVEPEPEVLEVSIRNAFRNKLGINEDPEESSSDMSPTTVIIYEAFPVQFIETF